MTSGGGENPPLQTGGVMTPKIKLKVTVQVDDDEERELVTEVGEAGFIPPPEEDEDDEDEDDRG